MASGTSPLRVREAAAAIAFGFNVGYCAPLWRPHGSCLSRDADSAGESIVAVWRPFIAKKIVGKLSELSNWRFELKTVRANIRSPQLVADHPRHPRPLRFELSRGASISAELRALAPEAVAAFENSLG